MSAPRRSPRRQVGFLGAVGSLLSAMQACAPADTTPLSRAAADLRIVVRSGAVTAPDAVIGGWTRVRVEEDGAGHILVIFRLPGAATSGDVRLFLAALDTAKATPAPAVALGGPEIGETGEIVIRLTYGRYVLGCVTRGKDGHRHANVGEMKVLTVTHPGAVSGREDVAPRATQDVQMVDFAYAGPERWPSGSRFAARCPRVR